MFDGYCPGAANIRTPTLKRKNAPNAVKRWKFSPQILM